MTAPIVRRGSDLTAAELHELLCLRVDVFVVEQECPYHETDGADLLDSTWHLWTTVDGEIASSARLLMHEAPPRIGRVVTARHRRSAGLAAPLVQAAHALALERGAASTHLDAQTYLVGWYERLGWTVAGDEFVEDGIPHTPMRRPA